MTHVFFPLKKLPLLSEFLLVILSAWMISGWLLPQSDMQTPTLVNKIKTSVAALPEINSIIAVQLFGQPPTKIQPKIAPVQQTRAAIKVALHLILLGTVVAGESSAAIISGGQSKEERAYFIGDSILPGIILQSVEADAITVNNHGVLERISLQQGAKLTTSAMPAGINPTSPLNINTRPRPSAAAVTKHMNRSHIQQQLQNFPALLSQARAMPHFVNGKMEGFSITDIVPGSLYQQAGLQNNDIVISVNGEKITGAQQAMGIYSALKNAQALNLELIRASGARETIHYDIR